jgi:hypothetical protein
LKQLHQSGLGSALLKLNNQRFKLFEHGTILRRLAECFQLLLPVKRNKTPLTRQFQSGFQGLYIRKIPQMLPQKDRKSASLFRGHVNPQLSISESLAKKVLNPIDNSPPDPIC